MNNEVLYSINGIAHRPDNAANIGLRIDWSKGIKPTDPEELDLTVNRVTLSRQAYTEVLRHKSTQGMFEGIPYTITVNTPMKTYNLEYFVDLTENAVFTDSNVEVTIRKRRSVDFFKEQADALSFELLNLKKKIVNLIDVNYVIQRDDQEIKLITLVIATAIMAKELLQQLKAIADIATEISSVTSAIAGVIKALYLVLYTVLLIKALIDMISQILNILSPKVRKFKACTAQNLIKQGVEYMGYNFSSTLMAGLSRLTILPVPLQKKNKSIFNFDVSLSTTSYTKGYPTAMDTTPTVGALIDAMCTTFNAVVRVIGKTVYLERKDYWISDSGTYINNTLSLQDTRENKWEYNTGDSWKRYVTQYIQDASDIHTLDNVKQADAEYSTELINVINPDLVTLKGLAKVNIPFAMGVPKTQLTFVEEQGRKLAKVADNVINKFGGNSSFESIVTGKLGNLMISQQYFVTTKMLWIQSGRIPTNYLNYVGAEAIYNNYHTTNQVVPNFKRIETSTVPFSGSQFASLVDNNILTDATTNNKLEILNFDWMPELSEATIEYGIRVPNEAINLKTIPINVG